MQITQKIKDKKIRYILYSLLMFFLFLGVGDSIMYDRTASLGLAVLFFASVLGSYITQYPSSSRYSGIIISVLPLSLTVGTYLTLFHFPNLSTPFRIAGLSAVAVLYYLISLVNNILLVIEEKEETIPLYRVAVTWGQIILIIISIPLFTGIYKFSQGPLVHSFFAFILTIVLTGYFLWSLSFDRRVRYLSFLDKAVNILLSAFIVFTFSIAVSFIPSEPFLRALFSSSVLLFNLNYLDAYMKNRINKTLIYTYGVIFFIFLFFILVFSP